MNLRHVRGLAFLVVLLAILRPGPARADRGAFVIRDFQTDITVFPDSDIEVVERVTVDFSEPRHGIYRTIPVRYTDPKGFAYSMGFRLLGVEDDGGRSQGTKVSHEGRYVKVRIGDADRTVNGRVVYVIRYRVTDALGSFPEYDEIYWNATGHEWNTTIGRATATVHLPAPLPADSLEVLSFVGRFGSREGSARVAYPEPGTVTYTLDESLGPMEGLTIVAAWPKGYVTFPSRTVRTARTLADNWVLLLPLFFAALLGWGYRRSGRDPEGPAATMVRYEAPPGITPGEIGTILDESVDLRDLTAVLVDLAVRGYVHIRVEESTLLFLFKKSEVVFERRRETEEIHLLPHERMVLKGIFEQGNTVTAGDLKEEFYTHIPGIKRALYDHLTRKGYFAGKPSSVRKRYRFFGVAAAGAVFLVGILTASLRGGFFPVAALVPAVAAVLTLIVFFAFAPAMPRRTRKGVEMRDWALGFTEFVERVEKPSLSAQEARGVFEALLPFAMALGISTQWARKFEGIYHGHPPAWYTGVHPGGFSTHAFEESLSTSMRQVGQQMTASPRSSGGGSGGGGFSGGGGGGGGGGSW
jgi:hypothetical protein